jgi:NACalpha-BTF3-like transcription factor
MEKAMTRINIPLESNLHRKMKSVAANLGLKVKEFVIDAIKRAIFEAKREKNSDEIGLSEDEQWLSAGREDALKALAEAEKDIPPKELKKYLQAFDGLGTPIEWNPKTGSFDEVKR